MPLTRAKVTIASRVMLPTYPTFAAWIGLVYATDPDSRLAGSPAFPLLPTTVWGVGFIVGAACLSCALVAGDRDLYAKALAPLLIWLGVWAAALAWSAIFDGTSFSAPAFPLFGAVACWATMLSLLTRET